MKCLCGCEQEIKEGKRFIRGHSSRSAEHRLQASTLGKSQEVQAKRSATLKQNYINGSFEIWNKGLTKETNSSMARSAILHKGQHSSMNTEFKKINMCLCGCGQLICRSKKYVSGHNSKSPEFKQMLSKVNTECWRNYDYVSKQRIANQTLPNKTEIKFEKILQPYGFHYVGDYQLNINGKFPDYWDGDHKLIELFGKRWHGDEDPQDRIDYFKQFGYDCLVIWDYELKNKDILDRISYFVRG